MEVSSLKDWKAWQLDNVFEGEDPNLIDETAMAYFPGGPLDRSGKVEFTIDQLRAALWFAAELKDPPGQKVISWCDERRGLSLKLCAPKFIQDGRLHMSVRQAMILMEKLGQNICVEFQLSVCVHSF